VTSTFTQSPGVDTVVPVSLHEYDVDSEPGTVVHRMPGTDAVSVVLDVAGPRQGTLGLVFGSATDAAAAVAFFRSKALFTLVDTEVPSIGMDFAVSGGRVRSRADDTRAAWVVSVPFMEVI
jgi:hypothetical protein